MVRTLTMGKRAIEYLPCRVDNGYITRDSTNSDRDLSVTVLACDLMSVSF